MENKGEKTEEFKPKEEMLQNLVDDIEKQFQKNFIIEKIFF